MNFLELKLSFIVYTQKLLSCIVNLKCNAPSAIGIATSTACNRRCTYCPQSQDPWKQTIITPKVWETFIQRIIEYRWKGIVSISFYNEPTLVPDLPRYVQDLKQASKWFRPIIFSNGDRISVIDQCLQVGLHRVYLTQHPPSTDQWLINAQNLQNRYGKKRVHIKRIVDSNRHNHAGQVNVAHNSFHRCPGPALGLSLSHLGNVVMCCMDYKFATNHGSILTTSIDDILNSEKFKKPRISAMKGKPITQLCKQCLR